MLFVEEMKKKKQLELEKEKETVKGETLSRPFDPESMEDEDTHRPPPVVSKVSYIHIINDREERKHVHTFVGHCTA